MPLLQFPDFCNSQRSKIVINMWNRFQTLLQSIPDLLTPRPVWIDRSLDDRLSDAIAQAVRDPDFRTQLLNRPQQALASMEIQIPPECAVKVVESTPGQTFVVLPIMTESEVAIVQSGLKSQRSQRATRSRTILKAWQDPDYKARLIADPKTVLLAEGFQIPDTTAVTVLENDAEHLHLVIPTLHQKHLHS
jgi:Nitrile hydratase, alpha chain